MKISMINGFFDIQDRLDYLSQNSDALPTLKKLVPWEDFRGACLWRSSTKVWKCNPANNWYYASKSEAWIAKFSVQHGQILYIADKNSVK